jgi:GNAT superfamily N-acetyltransferase
MSEMAERVRDEPPARAWQIRPYRQGDEGGIVGLARQVFAEQPPDRFSDAYWTWEFADNADGPAALWVADDHGTIVGHYAVIPRALRIGGEVRTGSIVVDVMTHPDYRLQGMFTALGRVALADAGQRGIEFSYGFPIRADVMPGHLRLGWRHLFDLPILVRPLKFRPLVRRSIDLPLVSSALAGAAWAGYRCLARPILKHLNPLPSPQGAVVVQPVTHLDDRFDELWRETRGQFGIMAVREARYLTWRYFRHPYHRYTVLAAERGDQVVGYVVIRTGELLGLRCGIIVDLLARSTAMGCLDPLLGHAMDRFTADSSLDLVGAMMTRGGPYYRALQRHGFLVTPRVFWFILHTNSPLAPDQMLADAAQWYLTWGDTDVI